MRAHYIRRLLAVLIATLLAGCRCGGPPEVQERSPTPALQQIGGRFEGEPDEPLSPEAAFEARKSCPTIARITARRASQLVHEVRVEGEGLDRVRRVGGALATGALANAKFERDGAALVFPVACDDCDVYLGFPHAGRTVACIGPGYSLSFRGGVLQ
jgi:hypothetical protein